MRVSHPSPLLHVHAPGSGDMGAALETVRLAATSRASIAISGERGTPKHHVAYMAHALSTRASGPFVSIRCEGFPEEQLEAELFAEGGCVDRAEHGTLFLDEIGGLSARVQGQLLVLLEDRAVERAGVRLPVDVRLVVSTSDDLQEAVLRRTLREDLYERMCVVRVHIPALRARAQDIAALADVFLHDFAALHGRSETRLTDAARSAIAAYDWPGNERELETVIERALVLSPTPAVELHEVLGLHVGAAGGAPAIPGASLEALERYAITCTLAHVAGSTARAAKILGISTRKVQYKLNEYIDDHH